MTKYARFVLTAIKVAPIKPNITLDALQRLDIRVGTIESVEDVEGSDKLVRLRVDLGDHRRTILAGLKKERQNSREIQGKQALFVVNLEPRRIFGGISEGMLSTWAMKTESSPFSRCLNVLCQTVQEQDRSPKAQKS